MIGGGTVPPCSAPRVPTRGRRSRTGGAVKGGSGAPFRCALAQRMPAEAGVPSRYCRDRGGSVSSCVCDADGWRDAVSTASGRSMPARGRRSEADLRFPPRARSSFTTLSRRAAGRRPALRTHPDRDDWSEYRPGGRCSLRDRESRRRPTLPQRCRCSTIGAGGLYYRVRNGNGCGPSARVTGTKNDPFKMWKRLAGCSGIETSRCSCVQ